MKPFEKVESSIVPLNVSNVDTDQIIPKQFLKRVERTGFGQYLFYDWRFSTDSSPNNNFVLNFPQFKGARILLAQENFGCGSSREHAPWALLDYGFAVIIAPSYADIFYNNCFQNGILPVKIPQTHIDALFLATGNGEKFSVDLQDQVIKSADGKIVISFDIDSQKKEKLLKGLDDISSTLLFNEEISYYEKTHVVY